MKFSIKDFFSKCDQIRRKLRIWSHLLKKSLMETSFFVQCTSGCIFSNMEKIMTVNIKSAMRNNLRYRSIANDIGLSRLARNYFFQKSKSMRKSLLTRIVSCNYVPHSVTKYGFLFRVEETLCM